MSLLVKKVVSEFKAKFSAMPGIIAGAPGRVNLIGEHTDYTGGYVLPVAIDREIIFAASKTEHDVINGYSVDYDESISIRVGEYDPKHACGWLRYIMGVLEELKKAGKPISGFNFTVGGNVPIGSGLSSSAALEMAVCKAMEGLFSFVLDRKSVV